VKDKFGLKKPTSILQGRHVGVTPSRNEMMAQSRGWRGWRQVELVVVEEVKL
jgi:hypothetical protein